MPTYAKALVALVTTALAQLAAILTGVAVDFTDITAGQWVTVALASIGAAAAVYGVRNGVDADPRTSTPDTNTATGGGTNVKITDPGMGLIEAVVAVLLIVLLVLLILRIT